MSTGRGRTAGPSGPAVSARPAGRWHVALAAFGAAAASGAISLGAPAEPVLWTAAGFAVVLAVTRLLIGLDAARPTKHGNSASPRNPAE